MEQPKLGKLCDENAARDAIHIALAPVVAGQTLQPGNHVILDAKGRAVISKHPHSIGIVDPWLQSAVREGQRFYLCLHQDTVTSLQHHWTHPAFRSEPPPNADDVSKSEMWLRFYAVRVKEYYCDDPEKAYESLMNDLRKNELCLYGISGYSLDDVPDAEDLRRHAAALGIKLDFGNFSVRCSC